MIAIASGQQIALHYILFPHIEFKAIIDMFMTYQQTDSLLILNTANKCRLLVGNILQAETYWKNKNMNNNKLIGL